LRENPLDAGQRRLLLDVMNAESRYLQQVGDVAGGLGLLRRALAVAAEASKRDPEDRWSRMGVSFAARSLGWALLEGGDAATAVPQFRRALALADRVSVEDPLNEFARLQAASARHGLGKALLSLHAAGPRTVEACAALGSVRDAWTALRDEGRLPPDEMAELERLPRWLERCPAAG
jgi:tetratricopeptide (TPR) repeat protein